MERRGITAAWLLGSALFAWSTAAWAPPICSGPTNGTDGLVLRVATATKDGAPFDVVDREYGLNSLCGDGVLSASLADPAASDGRITLGFQRRP